MIKKFIREVREFYQRPQGTIHLIETAMYGNEYQYIKECLDSGIVSTIGEEITTFEKAVARLAFRFHQPAGQFAVRW